MYRSRNCQMVLWLVPGYWKMAVEILTTSVTSRCRDNRSAAWFSDFLQEWRDRRFKSVALFKGILGWVLAGPEFTEYDDEYDPDAWNASDAASHTGQLC